MREEEIARHRLGLDPAAFYHVAYLVHDLEAAIEEYSLLLGATFPEPKVATPATGDEVRYVYSYEGPPFIELMEATGDSAWSRSLGEGFHHYGIATSDMP